MINWKVTKQEAELISQIVQRAMQHIPNYPDDYQTCNMDITACHLNGNPLDLQKLLDAPDFDFSHDVLGIRRHINRNTGQLEDFFSPRCSL